MKKLFFIFLFYCITAAAFAQYCSCISTTKDENMGVETKSGTTKSNDSYTLLFQKEKSFINLNKKPVYFLSLDVASRDIFSKSLSHNKGKIEFVLKDKSKLILENAKCFYNPVLPGLSVTFGAIITKQQLEQILLNPIVTFSAFGIVKTSFKEKKQREMQIVVSCLLSEDY
jgi:hypothetical protein